MIHVLRSGVLLSGFLFAWFFGQTSERFLLEVVRRFIALETSNAFFFNGVHLLVLLLPVLLFAAAVSLSWSGEPDWQETILSSFWGMALGVAAFRLFRLWVLFRAGGMMPEDSGRFWSEALGRGDIYLSERVLPFFLAGAVSGAVLGVRKKNLKNLYIWTVLGTCATFFWIAAAQRPAFDGLYSFLGSLIIMVLGGFFTAFVVIKIRKF